HEPRRRARRNARSRGRGCYSLGMQGEPAESTEQGDLGSRLKRAILIALAVGAASGVLGVLTGGGDVLAAIALTALWTVRACLSVLKAATWIDRPGHSAAFARSAIRTTILLLLAVIFTWGSIFEFIDDSQETFFLGSILAIVSTGWCATLGLVMAARSTEARFGGRLLLASAALAFLCFEMAAVESAFDLGPDDDEMI